jgi:hypothetical protein
MSWKVISRLLAVKPDRPFAHRSVVPLMPNNAADFWIVGAVGKLRVQFAVRSPTHESQPMAIAKVNFPVVFVQEFHAHSGISPP